MEIAANDQQPLNRPKGQKKPLANPFGNINNSHNDSNEFEPLTSPDQISNTNPQPNRNTNTLKTPFQQTSYNNEAEDELQGSISLGNEDNNTNNTKRTKSSTQPSNRDSYALSFGGDESGPTQRSSAGVGAAGGAGGSVLGSLMGFASLLTSGNQGEGAQGAAIEYDEENEPPLLEDLGIDLKLIKMRALSVLKFEKCQEEFVAEADMTGPLILFGILGILLLLAGKVHFGYLYGFGTLGTLGVYLIMNLLSQESKVRLYNTMSILGYCLFPVVVLAFFNIFVSLVNFFGLILAVAATGWATFAATNFFQVLLSLREQKWLIAYPIFLFYMVFVLITIF